MKITKLFPLLIALSFSLGLTSACSPPKKDAASAAISDEVIAQSSEHCVDELASACFVERVENGRTRFLTTEKYNQTWLTHEGMSDVEINLETVSDADYQQYLLDGAVPRMTYDGAMKLNLDVADEDGNPKVMPGRDANMRFIGLLFKIAPMIKKFAILMKGKGKVKSVGTVPKKGKGTGFFAKILGNGRNDGGSVFKRISSALDFAKKVKDVLPSPSTTPSTPTPPVAQNPKTPGATPAPGTKTTEGGKTAEAGKIVSDAKNARVSALSRTVEVPISISLGPDSVDEDVAID